MCFGRLGRILSHQTVIKHMNIVTFHRMGSPEDFKSFSSTRRPRVFSIISSKDKGFHIFDTLAVYTHTKQRQNTWILSLLAAYTRWPYTLDLWPYTLDCWPYTRYSWPYTLYSWPYTLCSWPHTLDRQPFTLGQRPYTLDCGRIHSVDFTFDLAVYTPSRFFSQKHRHYCAKCE